MDSPLQCPKCKLALDDSLLNQPELVPCRKCGTPIQAEIYPALFRRFAPGKDGEAVVVENEASCFFHPQKKAVLPCEACGRFLCALCDCELHGQHFCPACLETGKKKGKIKKLEDERTLYDNIALALAIYPMLIFYFTIVTAPMSLYVALRHWNSPRSIVHPTRLRLVSAIAIAGLQLAGWAFGIYFLATRARRHG